LKKKHILFILQNQAAPYDRRVWPEALSARDFDYDVTIICRSNQKAPKRHEIIDGIEIYRHIHLIEGTSKLSYLLEYFNSVVWEFILSIYVFIKKPFHGIHSANPPDHVVFIALFYKLFRIKFIYDLHDLSTDLYAIKFSKKDRLYKALKFMERISIKAADCVITTNESLKHVAIERGDKNPADVFSVRNGPLLSTISVSPIDRNLKNGFDYLVGYVGIIGEEESIDELLEIVKYIVYDKDQKNVKFIVIGSGTHIDHFVKLTQDMQLEHYVEFTGYIPYNKLLGTLAQTDVCINPEFKNDYTDQHTMLKIMDYMIVGKPIIQYDVTEGRVTADKASLFIKDNNKIEFAESILTLLRNPKERVKMGQFAKKRMYESLGWDSQSEKLKEAYLFTFTK